MNLDYENLLKRAMEKVPKKTPLESRFKIPQIVSEIQGNKTLIKNFSEITNTLRREQNHLVKYFLKELASPGNIQNNILILQTKVSHEILQNKIENYVKEFVYCKVCGEPDTKLERENRIIFMKCEACGARKAVRSL